MYPRRAGPCATAPPISVPRRYTNGFLTSMPGWAREITYWGNQSLRSVHHGNGRVYWLGLDEHDQRRPRYIALNSDPLAPPATVFDFEYDGAGNVKRWFANRYAYDRANRIEWMTLGSTEEQSYEYDDFGNLVDIERDGQVRYARRIPVDRKTNRLTSASYDAAGNVVVPPGGGTIFDWSGLGTMSWRNDPHGNGRTEYLYTADGERIGIYDHGQRQWTWRLRDLDGKLLREWRGGSESPLVFLDGFESGNLDLWTQDRSPACDDLYWVRDSVHRGGALLASYHWSTGVLHHHPDHLGSPILTTRGPIEEDYTAFFAYGEELDRDPGIGSVSVLRFTGHERDPNQEGAEDAWEDDLDYMHARYHSPVWGRFMSVDPVQSSDLQEPMSWNRYAYVRNNPVALVDPDGKRPASAWADDIQSGIDRIKQRAMFAVVDAPAGSGALLATAIGATADVLSIAADTLRAGQATGEAIGEGQGLQSIAGAIVVDASRTSFLVAPTSGAVRGAAARFGLGASGFGALSNAGRFGVQPYGSLSRQLRGSGLQAHHILEKRFAAVLGQRSRGMSAVAVTPSEHQFFTNAWRQVIPYGQGTANASRDQILSAARQIYRDYPDILKAVN